ncbi:putative capsular polysaccharide synthesis family protein [Chloroflexota bacterium]
MSHKISRLLRKRVLREGIETLRIRFASVGVNSPIIVYQMGKVGSTTVYKSLKSAGLDCPVYHVHFLSHSGLKQAEEYFRSLEEPRLPAHIRRGKALRRRIDSNSREEWKVITLVREPIGREISDFFENVDRYHPQLIDRDGRVRVTQAIDLLQTTLRDFDESTNYTCTWFDRELRRVFGVDVYAHPFPQADGFAMMSHDTCQALVLRVEDLDLTLESAVPRFLGTDLPIKMVRSNVGQQKKHSVAYRHAVDNLALPLSVCEGIYSSRYASHFYGRAMRDQFIRKWARQ